MTQLTRRSILGAIIASPAIVRASSLMGMPRAPYDVEAAVAWLNEQLQRDIMASMASMRPINFNHVAHVYRLHSPIHQITFNVPLI